MSNPAGYESEGRTFESFRARHLSNALAEFDSADLRFRTVFWMMVAGFLGLGVHPFV
jgi:hypothetical protein